jgi:hypothetical protein
MSQQISTAYVDAYKADLKVKFQQMTSRLRPYCQAETLGAEDTFIDRIGTVDPVELTTRHSDTPQMDTPHDRRKINFRTFVWNDFIDKPDKLRMLADPTSAYSRNAIAGLQRRMDDVLIEAALGTAYTGKDGTTPISSGWQVVAHDYTELTDASVSATQYARNLSVGKLRLARQRLEEAEAISGDVEGRELIIACASSQLSSLLADAKATSTDFAEVRALVNGEIKSYMGFKFVRTQRLKLKSGNANVRRCFAFVSGSAIALGLAEEPFVRVTERSDKNYSTQVYVRGSYGACRQWEEQIVEIECDERYRG